MKGSTRMFFDHGRHRFFAAVVAVVALALVAACSGGSDTLTAEEAESIADDALLVLADLPDANWEQQESQTSLEGLLPDAAGNVDLDILPDACQVLEDAIGDLPALIEDAAPLASSSRTFTAIGQTLNLDAVATSVVVFEEPDGATDALTILDDAFSADSLENCILQAGTAGGGEGLTIVDFTLATPDYALDGSTALRAEINAIALILPLNLAVDIHAFTRDNAFAFYVAIEVNSTTLEAEHANLLATFASRVEEAQN